MQSAAVFSASGQYAILQSEIMQSAAVFSATGQYAVLQSEIMQSTVILRQGAIRDPAPIVHAVNCGLQCIKTIRGPAIIDHAVNCDPQAGGQYAVLQPSSWQLSSYGLRVAGLGTGMSLTFFYSEECLNF
jgi:hypothetical protein